MSSNTGYGVRRLASPSTGPRPLRATKQFNLVSPTRNLNTNGKKSSPSSSPVQLSKSRKSPVSPVSERTSPNSPASGFKVERPKPIRPSPGPAGIKRTSSLDTIAIPYLTGQWPRGDYQTQLPVGPDYLDKTTQTPEEWEDLLEEKRRKKGGSHKRSSSVGNSGANDNLKEIIKARLAKTKEKASNTQRTSPVQASHSFFSATPAGGSFIQTKAVAIPISHNSIKTVSPIRIRNSVEGLNQEIETALGNSKEFHRAQEPTPDGHRAPVLELTQIGSSSYGNHNGNLGNSNTAAITRTVDTQTPSQIIDSLSLNEETGLSSDSGSGSSRPPSTSPTIPIMPGGVQMDSSPRPPSRCDSRENKIDDLPQDRTDIDGEEMDTISPDHHLSAMNSLLEKCAPSPRPNKTFSFAREPPDGCEKVKIIDEPRRVPVMKEPLLYCPLLKEGTPLIPSTVSAFCPLSKTYHHVTASELPLNRSSSYGDLPSGKTSSYAEYQGNRSPTYSPSNNNYTAALSGHGNGSPSNNNNNNNALRSSELELQ